MGRGNIFKGVKSIDFYHRFNSEEPYYEYLSEIKWKDDYVCKKCENIHYCKGRLSYSRHCTRCKYDESPTARTVFDKCKFSIEQTFHIAFKISTKKKGMSSLELSEEYGLRQKTCWEFKWKIQQAMQSSKNTSIYRRSTYREFYVGEEEEGVVGQKAGKKKLIVVALEMQGVEFGKAYAQVIDDVSSKSFKPSFETYINKDTTVITNEWNGYKP